MSNADRAAWAQTALDAFTAETCFGRTLCEEEQREQLGDLVANLLHLARAKGMDPARLASGSLKVFEEEEREEADDAEPDQ